MEKYLALLNNLVDKVLPKNKKEREWYATIREPKEILKKHESLLYCEVVFYVLGFLTFLHAIKNGGRYKWLWLATIVHGGIIEYLSFYLPDIESHWHAQSMVMLCGQKLPLHILFVYPALIYTSVVAVSHMNLRWWAEPFAVGLSVVLMDIPFDLMGVKLLWWTWHDDDPDIYDRHYWVPWTSYYFKAVFSSSFAFLFFSGRRLFRSGLKFQSTGFFSEIVLVALSSALAVPLGALQFWPVYHTLHDGLAIHSEVCVLLLVGFYAVMVWSADRVPFENARNSKYSLFTLMNLTVLLHFGFYIYLVLYAKPQKIQSVGFHQPVGPCDKTVEVHNLFGHNLHKTKYLCADRFYEDYFDFKCVKKTPSNLSQWYTICGTAYSNHTEYVVVVGAFIAVGLYWFWQMLCRSGNQPKSSQRSPRHKHHRD